VQQTWIMPSASVRETEITRKTISQAVISILVDPSLRDSYSSHLTG